tara:strand:- start:226 stop:780 length:555 start_codon:yes stop_codon:yes gene_type:complete
MSQFPQHNFHQKVWADGAGSRLVSFSIIKTTTYEDEEHAVNTGDRLKRLKDDHFGDQIKIPYFEYEVNGIEVTYQAEYIKGRQLMKEYVPIVKKVLLERENPWTIIDVSPANFVVDTYHEGIGNGTAPVYVIDLDSYGYFPMRTTRVEKWNGKCERRGWYDLMIQDTETEINYDNRSYNKLRSP